MASFGKALSSVLRARGVAGKFSVKKIDRGLNQIKRVLRSIKNDKSYVKAGLLGKASKQRSVSGALNTFKGQRKGGGLNNVQLGVIHEFGTGSIPARPFISASFRKHRPEYQALLQRLGAGVYSGKIEYVKVLGIIGQKMASDMKAYVTQGSPIPPPNAPATIAAKMAKAHNRKRKTEGPIEAPRTLVDTGAMVGSITYEVITRGSGEEREP